MTDGRGGKDLLQFGMHRNSERDCCGVPGLLRPHREHAVADVLAADAGDVAAALRCVDSEGQRQPRLGGRTRIAALSRRLSALRKSRFLPSVGITNLRWQCSFGRNDRAEGLCSVLQSDRREMAKVRGN